MMRKSRSIIIIFFKKKGDSSRVNWSKEYGEYLLAEGTISWALKKPLKSPKI